MLISNTISTLLKQNNISVKQLAEKVGGSTNGLYKALEKNDFKVSQLQKIADVLEVDICEFFGKPGNNEFEEELKYFIEMHNPLHKNYIIFDISGNAELYKKDPFLEKVLSNVYIDRVYNESFKILNQKYNKNFFISNIHIERKGFTITHSGIVKPESEFFEGNMFLDRLLYKFYESISLEDIKMIQKQINKNKKELPIFLENSKFINWYKETFNVDNMDLQYVLMDISSKYSIYIDEK